MIKEFSEGFIIVLLFFVKGENGFNVVKLNEFEVKGVEIKDVGVVFNMNVVLKSDVGVSWYFKIVFEVNFVVGKIISVSVDVVEFMIVFENVSDGDVIIIVFGIIVVFSVFIIDKIIMVIV